MYQDMQETRCCLTTTQRHVAHSITVRLALSADTLQYIVRFVDNKHSESEVYAPYSYMHEITFINRKIQLHGSLQQLLQYKNNVLKVVKEVALYLAAHLSNLFELPSRLASLVACFAQLGNGDMTRELPVVAALDPCRAENTRLLDFNTTWCWLLDAPCTFLCLNTA